MKIDELFEGLKANWTVDKIRDLTPAKLKTLHANAKGAMDDKVLDMINQVTQERIDHQEKLKSEADKLKKEKAIKRESSFVFGNITLSKEDLLEVSRKFEEVVGDTFPDGDPIDLMIPFIRRKFKCEHEYVCEILDKAIRVNLGVKSYTDYMAETWDNMVKDGMFPELNDLKNPWR